MSLLPNITLRLWPKTLLWRLLLPLTGLLVVVGVSIWVTVDTLAQERRDAVVDTVKQVSTAFQTLPGSREPNPVIESFLLSVTTAPIRQTAIVDSSGRAVLSALRPENGSAYLHEDAPKLAPPSAYEPAMLVFDDSVIYWQPTAIRGRSNAWLMVSADLKPINRWRLETLTTGLTLYAACCAVVLIISAYSVRRSVNAIRDSARFANDLTGNPAGELAISGASEELNHLVDTLNRIAKHWHHRQQLEEQANAHLRLHKAAIDLHSAVFITDGAGRIEYVNQHFCIASGYAEQELLGKSIGILNSGYHEDHYFKNLWRSLALGRVWQGTLCNRNKHGEAYWVQCTIAPIKDHLGRPCQYLAIQTLTSVEHQPQGLAATK
jgi:PAS domain S-box-containing protein